MSTVYITLRDGVLTEVDGSSFCVGPFQNGEELTKWLSGSAVVIDKNLVEWIETGFKAEWTAGATPDPHHITEGADVLLSAMGKRWGDR